MKLKKIISAAAASMVAAGVVATSASAAWRKPDGATDQLNVGSDNYMVIVYCNGDATDMPATDLGIDLAKLGYASFTFTVPESDDLKSRDFFDGQFGGAVGVSIHTKNIEELKAPTRPKASDYDGDEAAFKAAMEEYNKKVEEFNKLKTKKKSDGTDITPWEYYNWFNSKEYWGLIDKDAKNGSAYLNGVYLEGELEYIATQAQEKDAFIETLAPYTYRIKAPIANPVAEGDCTVEDIKDYRLYIQAWGGSGMPWAMYNIDVTRTVLYDLDNKPMVAFDNLGKVVETNADDEKEPVMPEYPNFEEDPGTESTGDTSTGTDSAATSGDSNTSGGSTNSADSASSGSTTSTTSSTSNDGGAPVGLIAGIAGGVVAVIVVVVIVVVKKKKG